MQRMSPADLPRLAWSPAVESLLSKYQSVFKFQNYIVDWYIALSLYRISLIHPTPSFFYSDLVTRAFV